MNEQILEDIKKFKGMKATEKDCTYRLIIVVESPVETVRSHERIVYKNLEFLTSADFKDMREAINSLHEFQEAIIEEKLKRDITYAEIFKIEGVK